MIKKLKKYFRIILEKTFQLIIFVTLNKKEREEFQCSHLGLSLNNFRVKTTLDILEDYVRHMEQKLEYVEPKRSLNIPKPKPFLLRREPFVQHINVQPSQYADLVYTIEHSLNEPNIRLIQYSFKNQVIFTECIDISNRNLQWAINDRLEYLRLQISFPLNEIGHCRLGIVDHCGRGNDCFDCTNFVII